MADSVISFLLENLNRILSQEADLLLGVEDEVKSLQSELRLTEAYIQSFKQTKRTNQLAAINVEFVKQVSELAREAEDVVDEYVASVAQQRGENLLVRARHNFWRILVRHRVAEEIKGIKKRFEDLYKNREKFGIQINTGDVPMEDESSSMRRRLVFEETDVVGLDADAMAITERLMKGEARLVVIPVVGMGGIGKTTLARKVYNDPIVIKHFDFRAWVYVSQAYRVRDLLQALLRRAMGMTAEDMKDMSNHDLGLELRKYLRSTRYIIVLDDVWRTEFWEELNQVFANNMYGSRIIITTRHKDVAQVHVNNPRSPPHNLRFLRKEESWELFSKKVFREEKCPEDLEDLGKQMADKCGGLPLAIVVLAGVLLKKEKTLRWWSKVSSSVGSILTEQTDQCKEILELSYKNLPNHLKPCFLYFGLFPKDLELSARQLVGLWIAEGFVQKKDKETMEEVAEDYLEDLIARNMVQISKRRFDGTMKTCCVHDLLQDLCVLKAKEEKFLEVLGYGSSSSSLVLLSNLRRLGLHSNTLKFISSHPSASKLRSILCFGLDERPLSSKEWKLVYKGFPLLRVLDARDVGVEVIPDDMDKLIHLRYLMLKSLTAQTLPASISNLWNLQTLEVTAPCIDRPLIDIWKMKELRHLYFRGQVVIPEPLKKKFVKDESGKRVSSNLLTLSCVSPESCTSSIFSMLPNLVKLGIHGDLEEHDNMIFKNLSILNSLQTLKLERDRRCKELDSLSYARFPPNLTKLTLVETQLMEDPMDILGKLPNLQVLKLKNAAYSGRDLHCRGNGFPKLQVLKLVNLAIRSWTISDQEGSMSSLRSVVINRCGHLDGLPSALQKMPAFQELELWSPHVSLVNEARQIEASRGKEQFMLVIYQT